MCVYERCVCVKGGEGWIDELLALVQLFLVQYIVAGGNCSRRQFFP